MSEQRALFSEKIAPPIPGELTDKQARALELVKQAGPEGITGHDLGFQFHGHDRFPCDLCKTVGLSYARALKKKRHVVERKGGRYVAVDLPDTRPGPGELPEGF